MKWTIEAGIHTGIQLVLGMPGENNETIQETIEYCKYVTTLSSDKNPNDISCNSAQALPGTPLYEYGRHKGLIGQDIDAEEAYLLSISDRNARDESTTLNFTDESTLICRTWRPRLTIEVNYNYVKTFGVSQYYTVLAGNRDFINLVDAHTGTSATELRSGAYIPPSLIRLILSQRFGFAMMCYPVFFYHVRSFLPLMVLINTMRRDGTSSALDLLREFVKHKIRDFFKTDKFLHGYKSLRQIVSKDLGTF